MKFIYPKTTSISEAIYWINDLKEGVESKEQEPPGIGQGISWVSAELRSPSQPTVGVAAHPGPPRPPAPTQAKARPTTPGILDRFIVVYKSKSYRMNGLHQFLWQLLFTPFSI